MSRFWMTLCLCLAASACGSPAAPTSQPPAAPASQQPAPTPAPPGPPASVLVVDRATMYRFSATSLAPHVQLRETSGKSPARVDSLAFNLADGEPWADPRVWPQSASVAPGGTTDIHDFGIYGDPDSWLLTIPAGYTGRVAVEITYFDGDGRKGTVSAVADIIDRH